MVRGGGGITPDVELPGPAPLPVWWSLAADSGFDAAVRDSVAVTLGADLDARRAWLTTPAQWRTMLLPPFLTRVRARLKVAAQTDTALDARLARILAARATEVRWGPEAREEFVSRNGPDLQAALSCLPRLTEPLAPPPR